jgi:rubrerythrin
MDARIEEIFNATIIMERRIAGFYNVLAGLFPDDAVFWEALSKEEETHAAIIHAGKDYFYEEGLFPIEMLDPDLDRINELNFMIEEKLRHFKSHTPTQKEALLFALQIENSSGEYYFQIVLSMPMGKAAIKLMKELAEGERDHIRKVMAMINMEWPIAA